MRVGSYYQQMAGSIYLWHQIEDASSAVYDDDPIAVEPQLDKDELDGDSDESNVQGEIISAEPHKGSAD